MLTWYIVSAIIGGGLILLSALGGFSHGLMDGIDANTDFDVDHDLDVDHNLSLEADHHVDIDHHTDMAKDLAPTTDFWLPFLSLRFWVYAIGGFGVMGTILTLTNAAPAFNTLWLSIAFGVTVGSVIAYAIRKIKVSEIDYQVREKDFLGVAAQLTVAPRNGEPGKVRMLVKGETIDMLALPHEGVELERGEEVVVVGVDGTRVRVARLSDIMDQP